MFSKGRTVVLVLLFLAGVVNYLDRSALSIAAPFITEDLHLSPTQLGIVFSSFSVGYAIFNFIGGLASDEIEGKIYFVRSHGCLVSIQRCDCASIQPYQLDCYWSTFWNGRRAVVGNHQ